MENQEPQNEMQNDMQSEETIEDQQQEGGFKNWLQDNMRIIISILIVIAIAGGIYSYSKRVETPDEVATVEDESALMEDEGAEEGLIEIETDTDATAEENQQGVIADQNGDQTVAQESNDTSDALVIAELSQETDNAYVEKVARGEGTTHLARRALANHLEKNTDSELKVEQKIYIEDYIRKNAAQPGKVYSVGDTLEVRKDLIEEAINSAKQLSDAQIQNLSKYVPLVPSLA